METQYTDGLVQDCSNSNALAIVLLQSCTKPSIYASIRKSKEMLILNFNYKYLHQIVKRYSFHLLKQTGPK